MNIHMTCPHCGGTPRPGDPSEGSATRQARAYFCLECGTQWRAVVRIEYDRTPAEQEALRASAAEQTGGAAA